MKKKKYVLGLGFVGMLLNVSPIQAQVFQNLGGDFVGMHRGSPSVVDYNNDGIADLYYGGMTWLLEDSSLSNYTKSWTAQSFLYTGKGNNKYTMLRSNLYDNPDGRFLANGLPPMYYQKVIWFDYNNDGNIDFFTQGKSGGDLDITGTPDKNYTWLFTNSGATGGWQFTQVPNTGIVQSIDPQKAQDYGNINASYSDVGDYDNDGYQDFITLGEHNYYKEGEETAWERYIKLYHNNGDGTFSEMKVFNPIPYDSNPRPAELFEIDAETYENVPLHIAKPMSSGGLRFADLNNDGSLDVVASGYCNDGGACFYIYKNNGDGTFQEVDLRGQEFTGVYESDLAIADINNDGWLDIISTGTPNNGNKRADLYLNEGATAPFRFSASTVDSGNGLYGVSASHIEAADMNGDGLTDLLLSGWTNVDDKGWGGYLFTQNADQTFSLSETIFGRLESGGYSIGDIMGSGSVDLFTEQAGYTDTWILHEDVIQNTSNGNTAPQRPSQVQANTDVDGNTIITWEEASDEQTDAAGLRYNVYVKNIETGAISMILPADVASGKLRVMRDWQLLAHGGENIGYPVKLKAGNYEIGVSAIDPGYKASAFTTTTLNITFTGVQSVVACKTLVESVSGGVLVHGADNMQVSVFNPDGTLAALGTVGKMIPVQGNGLYIVKAGQEITKVVVK